MIRDGDRYALGGYLIAENGDPAIGGTPVMDGDEGLESRLRALEKEIEASRPIPLTGEGESSPFSPLVGRYDYNKAENNDALCGKMARYAGIKYAISPAVNKNQAPQTNARVVGKAKEQIIPNAKKLIGAIRF